MKQLTKRLAILTLCSGLLTLTAQAQGPTLDPSFAITSAVGNSAPTFPQIYDLVQQPDGKLIVAGELATLNNLPVNKVCRLLPNGQVDASFSAAQTDGDVFSVALQPDGKLLIAGNFRNVGGRPQIGIARLLPTGALDPGFSSPLGSTPSYSSRVQKVVVQSALGIIILGDMIPPGSGTGSFFLARLTEDTGALDPTFQPIFNTFDIRDVLAQPNGRLVFSGQPRLIGGQQCNVWGTLPNGALDPAFVPLPGTVEAYGLVRDPGTGNLYVTGAVPGMALDREPVRLLPNGVRDLTFNTAGAFVAGSQVGNISSLAVQPNGRLLLGGTIPTTPSSYVGSWRLLPSGARDPSYQASNGPGAAAFKVLVQPDGALVFGGYFSTAGGFALNCLARMLDPNVLAINKQQAEAGLVAWPVPAREVLHLRLAPGGGPVPVALLDALGRTVLARSAAADQTALALPMAGLPPGAYLLRVAYPSGPVLRRVAVE